MSYMGNQVAWVGQDGNLWWRQGDNVINAGSADNYQFTHGGLRALNLDTPLGQGPGFAPGVTRIDDPVNPTRTPAPISGGGGGGGRQAPQLDEAAVRNTQRAIDEIPGILQAALAAERQRFRNVDAQFDAQEQAQRAQHDESVITNQQNYDSTFMDSIRSGIRGLGGLMNILRGTGAGGSSAEGQVRDVVGAQTAQDIRGGADTQRDNQRELDSTLSTFLTSLQGRRDENRDMLENNRRSIRRDSNTQLQDLYGKMAGFYGDAEMQPQYNKWMGRAGNLTPKIGRDSRTRVSPYNTKPVEVRSPQLTAFAGPSQPDVMSRPSDGQVGSGIFAITDRRRDRERDQEQTPTLVGA